MVWLDPKVAKVRISKGTSLGAMMSEMRIWLDGRKIQPARWDATGDAKGFNISVVFHRDDESELFRQKFVENQPESLHPTTP